MAKLKGILQLIKQFPNEETCRKHLTQLRWGNNISCPFCSDVKVYAFKDEKTYKCSKCKKKFNVKTNTIFENTKIPLNVWFIATYLLNSRKKGISSEQLANDLNITQKTAWFVLHRLREASTTQAYDEPLQNTIEIDETYVGGKNKNRHRNKKVRYSQGRSTKDKTPVVGLMERGGQLRTFVVSDTRRKTLENIIEANVHPDA